MGRQYMFDKFWQSYGPRHVEFLHILADLLNSSYIVALIWMKLNRDIAPKSSEHTLYPPVVLDKNIHKSYTQYWLFYLKKIIIISKSCIVQAQTLQTVYVTMSLNIF